MMERVLRPRSLVAIFVFALALLVRVAVVDRQGLWADEVFSLAIATGHSLEHPAAVAEPSRDDFIEGGRARPASEWTAYMEHGPRPQGVADVVRAARLSDTNPPLYYVILYYWTRVFGTSDRALKGFSVFFALAAFPFIARLARRFGGREAVVPACVLYAFAPACIYYSTEGRMYSLCWFWVTATAEAMFWWRSERRSLLPVLSWILLSVGGFYSHYFFSFVWAPFLVWILLYPGRAGRGRIVLAACAVLILTAPWYAFVGSHMSAWRVTSGWLELKPWGWSFPDALMKAILGHLSGQGIWGGGRRENVFMLVLLAVCFLTFALCRRTRMFGEKRALIWMWFTAPVAGIVFLDTLQGTYALINYRYVAMGLPAAVLFVATAFGLWPAVVRWSVLVIVLLVWTPRIESIALNISRNKSPYREVGGELSEKVEENGIVIAHSIPSGVLGLARYARPDLEIAAWVERLGVRQDSDLERIVAGHDQIVLARVHEVWEDDRVDRLLERSAGLVSDEWRASFRLLEYRVDGSAVGLETDHSGT